MTLTPVSLGTTVRRVEGPLKVTGTARYAAEQAVADPLALAPVQATIARGTVTAIDATAATALAGVVAVISHENAGALADTSDTDLAVLQSPDVRYRGQYVAAVLAESPETARQAAALVVVTYDEQPHTTALDEDSAERYAPENVIGFYPTDVVAGDPDAALDAADVTVRATYRTATQHHNPMEPHATVAHWQDGRLVVFESSQAVWGARDTLCGVFGLDEDAVDVMSPHVGGGFGAKGGQHPNTVLTVLAARAVPGRSVRFAVSRREMFEVVGHRPETIQHVALGADTDGTLQAIVHDAVEHTSRVTEFAEPTAVYSRGMYAAPHRRTTHRLVPLDLGVPTFMRAPGEAPGSFGAESAMDELAVALGMDPIELRVRNEPDVDPWHGLPFSSRNLVACLRRGAERFGWADRDPAPRTRLVDGWWHGTGVASSFFPAIRFPGSQAIIRFHADAAGDDHYVVEIAAADVGQGARTVLTQVAADALGVPADRVRLEIGDTALPTATVAGGSGGTASWGSTIVDAADRFRDKWGDDPEDGAEADGATPDNPWADEYTMAAYGAHFAEVAVHADTGEIRVPRMLGVFAAGRILNPDLARSQFLGAMTWGLSAALHEESVVDPRFGHVVNHDLAGYHIAAHADVGAMEAEWVDEEDPYVNPMGSKGIGEIGIVGAAAAIANAAFHATGVRVRSLPITVDDFLG